MSENKQQPIGATEVVPMFPTLVWKLQLPEKTYKPLNGKIKTKLKELERSTPGLSTNGKMQTDPTLHELPEFKELVEIINSPVEEFLDFLKIDYNTFSITGCWANISPPGDGHRPHAHPNNYLSGVYYVQTQANAQTIIFDDPRPQAQVLAPATKEITDLNADQIHITTREGLLVLFPSWVQHHVPVNNSQQDRISIAFNIMFSRYGENMAKPKWEGNVKT